MSDTLRGLDIGMNVPESRILAAEVGTGPESPITRPLSTRGKAFSSMRIGLRCGWIPNVLLLGGCRVARSAGGDSGGCPKRRFASRRIIPAIAKAMEAAAAGDTILVAPGSYQESIVVKDAVILRSEKGAGETTIAYGEGDANQTVLLLQRCSNSTQIVGFTIDGRKAAARGILALGDGSAVVSQCTIVGAAERGRVPAQLIPLHRGHTHRRLDDRGNPRGRCFRQRPELRDREWDQRRSRGDKAPRRRCSFATAASRTTRKPAYKPKTASSRSPAARSRAGRQGSCCSTFLRSSRTCDRGALAQRNRARELDGYRAGLHDPQQRLRRSDLRHRRPKIFQSTFEDNPTAHVHVEGDAVPVIGGSVENANLFVGQSECVVQSQATQAVNASYNYWGKPCATKDQVKRLPGGADVIRKPWVTADLRNAFNDCESARKHSRTPTTEQEAQEDAEAKAEEAAGAAGRDARSSGQGRRSHGGRHSEIGRLERSRRSTRASAADCASDSQCLSSRIRSSARRRLASCPDSRSLSARAFRCVEKKICVGDTQARRKVPGLWAATAGAPPVRQLASRHWESEGTGTLHARTMTPSHSRR